jgi:uncharacterized protein
VRQLLGLAALALAGCGERTPDPRGVEHDETLLSLSASGEAETVPDVAYLEIGVETFAPGARAASEANNRKSEELVRAFGAMGVAEKDTQTRNLSISRIDYGPRKGQYQASNVMRLRLRDIAKGSEVVAAATEAGANILSGPSLQISDPEKANRGAYIAAYRAARTRAEAYAEAAGMEIGRVLAIRDGGMSSGYPRGYEVSMDSAAVNAPPPIVRTEQAPPPIRPGSSLQRVSVQVDFALRRK